MTGSKGPFKKLDQALLGSLIAEFGAPDVQVTQVGPGRSVTVGLDKGRSIAEEGHLLMELEAHLRARTGLPVELYLEPLIDNNKLRRNIGERLKLWNERRDQLKEL
ncbi:MAG: hypothetical protein ACE5Q6_09890 [Dehalococcoidia bacterium]